MSLMEVCTLDALRALSRGTRFLQFGLEMFGPVALDKSERAMRFVEEAIELGQAVGLTKEETLKLVDRAYDRPAGEIEKEVSQAQLTLEGLAEICHVRPPFLLAEREMTRALAIPKEEWDRRHASKIAAGTANVRSPS